MADIDIKIGTTGDPAGAEVVEKSIKKVGEELDVVNKKTTETAVRDNEANLRGRAIEWAKVGEKIREYGAAAREAAGNIEGLDKETQQLVEKVGAATETVGGYLSTISQGFAAGGPIGAVVAGATKGVGDFIKAWGEAGTEIDKANTKSLESVEMWKKFQQLKLNLPLVEALETANRLLDDQLEKMRRNARVAESERALEQAKQESAGADAVRSGNQTVQGAEAANLETSVNNQVAAIREKLATATAAQAALTSGAARLITAGEAGILVEGFDNLDAQLKAGKTLQDKAIEAMKTLNDDTRIGENEIARIKVQSTEQVKQLGEAQLDALTQSVTQQRDALKAEVNRLGANATSGARDTLAILEQILEKDGVRADELGKYAEAQGRLNGMAEKNNAAVLEAFRTAERNAAAFQSGIQAVQSRLSAITNGPTAGGTNSF